MEQNIIRRLIFFYIILLYFLTLLVPTFKSLPLTPHEQIYIYLATVVFPLLRPQVLNTKVFIPSFLLLLFHVFYLLIGNYDNLDPRVTETLFDFFIALFFVSNLWLYIKDEKDFKRLKLLAKLILSFIILTLVTTFIGLLIMPSAVRDLVGNDNQEEVHSLLRLNIASYDFQYLMVFFAPLTYYFYRLHKGKLWLILLVFITIEVVYAQIVSVIFLFFLNMFLSFIVLSRKIDFKKYIQNLFFVTLLFFLTKHWIVQFLFYISEMLPPNLEMVATKFKEVALYLESGNKINVDDNFNMYGYEIRRELSKNSFFESPITGGGESGGHHFWLDLLAEHGIFGFFPWVLLFVLFFNSTKKIFPISERVLILNSMLIFIMIGLNKNILIFSMPVAIFFVLPLFLLVFGEKNKKFR